MPLPFLQNKKTIAGVIMSKRKPEGGSEETSGTEADNYDGIEECMKGFKRAFEEGDTKSMAKHFKEAFQIADSEPHNEGEHTNEEDNSFQAQNEKAAK